MKRWTRELVKLDACQEAVDWSQQFETFEEAWSRCERGDWMLWLMGKRAGEPDSDSRRQLVLAACQCARLALPYVQKGEERPLKAIETAEKWARREDNITLKDVEAAAHAAYAAHAAARAAANAAYAAVYAVSAADAAANAAANAGANAFYAAHAAARAAANAAYAAVYAVSAAANAANAAARLDVLKQCADILREYFPLPSLRKEELIR